MARGASRSNSALHPEGGENRGTTGFTTKVNDSGFDPMAKHCLVVRLRGFASSLFN
jgi:hypothetical protein